MVSPQQDLAWRISGPQGSGVDTAAGLFARACAVGGLHIFGRREYYSNFEQRIAARMPSYRSTPPARRIIADVHGHSTTGLQTIFAELAIT